MPKDSYFESRLEIIHLTGHVNYTDSKKVNVMMPAELEFSLKVKDEGFTLCNIYRNDTNQKCLRIYNAVPKEVFHHVIRSKFAISRKPLLELVLKRGVEPPTY